MTSEYTDTQRLDWLEQNRETVYICSHQERRPTTDAFRHYELVYVHEGWAVNPGEEASPTPRAAIDKAMRSSGVHSPAVGGSGGGKEPTVFDELIAFEEECEVKPTFADAVRVALAAKKRASALPSSQATSSANDVDVPAETGLVCVCAEQGITCKWCVMQHMAAGVNGSDVPLEQRPDYCAGFVAGQRYAESHLGVDSSRGGEQ